MVLPQRLSVESLADSLRGAAINDFILFLFYLVFIIYCILLYSFFHLLHIPPLAVFFLAFTQVLQYLSVLSSYLPFNCIFLLLLFTETGILSGPTIWQVQRIQCYHCHISTRRIVFILRMSAALAPGFIGRVIRVRPGSAAEELLISESSPQETRVNTYSDSQTSMASLPRPLGFKLSRGVLSTISPP